MDEIKTFKEKTINNYISNNLDFSNLENIDVNKIKKELKQLLQEEPAIRINYRKDEILVEGGSKKAIENIESITIVFTYETQQPNGRGGYINVPVPVEKEFLLG
jgi:hypothetical protein